MSVNRTIKIIAAITCIAFLWQDVVWASGSDFLRVQQLSQQQTIAKVKSAGNSQRTMLAPAKFEKAHGETLYGIAFAFVLAFMFWFSPAGFLLYASIASLIAFVIHIFYKHVALPIWKLYGTRIAEIAAGIMESVKLNMFWLEVDFKLEGYRALKKNAHSIRWSFEGIFYELPQRQLDAFLNKISNSEIKELMLAMLDFENQVLNKNLPGLRDAVDKLSGVERLPWWAWWTLDWEAREALKFLANGDPEFTKELYDSIVKIFPMARLFTKWQPRQPEEEETGNAISRREAISRLIGLAIFVGFGGGLMIYIERLKNGLLKEWAQEATKVYAQLVMELKVENFKTNFNNEEELAEEIGRLIGKAIVERREHFLKYRIPENFVECFDYHRLLDSAMLSHFNNGLASAGVEWKDIDWLNKIGSPVAKVTDKLSETMDESAYRSDISTPAFTEARTGDNAARDTAMTEAVSTTQAKISQSLMLAGQALAVNDDVAHQRIRRLCAEAIAKCKSALIVDRESCLTNAEITEGALKEIGFEDIQTFLVADDCDDKEMEHLAKEENKQRKCDFVLIRVQDKGYIFINLVKEGGKIKTNRRYIEYGQLKEQIIKCL